MMVLETLRMNTNSETFDLGPGIQLPYKCSVTVLYMYRYTRERVLLILLAVRVKYRIERKISVAVKGPLFT